MPLETRLRPRPLSPHLAIYRRTATMMMSIAHRLTGAALYSGTPTKIVFVHRPLGKIIRM
jgi:succinate dehydrogenase / fumarate reductase cytochrome b subunit